jgi:hypothetical protein
MGGELNNDWVLWASIGAIVFSVILTVAWAWKATRGIEGLEEDQFKDDIK